MAGAALDAAYDSGAAVADAPRYRADWAARSERMRARHAATLDISYGGAPRTKLDLFLAASPPAPTLIFIHGGYWQMNQKENFAFVAEGPLAHGINVATLGYTLAPDAGMDRIVGEIRTGVAWLADNIARHGGDPPLLHVSDLSAGGHLTAMAMDDRRGGGGAAGNGGLRLQPLPPHHLHAKDRPPLPPTRPDRPPLHL